MLNRHPDGLEKCVGCELCAWACPADAIYVEGGDNTEEARYSPGERYGAIYQINYLRCIFCGLCIEACPTRSLTMSNEYELADDDRQRLIYTKEQLMAPLLPGMEAPPHPMRLGDSEQAYYVDVPARAGRTAADATPGGPAPSVPTAETAQAGAAAQHRLGPLHRGLRLRGKWFPVTTTLAAVEISTGEAVLFWILGPIALAGAFGTVLARNAIHAALFLVMTMGSLGIFYFIQEAPFLGVVQIIVYTGAIMILFLFVLMLVGRDSSDSIVETLRGQRWAGDAARDRVRAAGRRRALPGGAQHPDGRAGQPERRRRQRQQRRRAAVHQVPVRVRAHLGAADHRRGRRDGARRTSSASPASSAASGRCRASGSAPAGRSRCRARACSPPTTRSPPRRCCRTAASRRRASARLVDEPLTPDELERHGGPGLQPVARGQRRGIEGGQR